MAGPGNAVHEILGEPLGRPHQRGGQRITRRHRGDVVLRVHPQHQPGPAYIEAGDRSPAPIFGPPVVSFDFSAAFPTRAHLHRTMSMLSR